MSNGMNIQEASKMYALSVSTLRSYIKQGLIVAEKKGKGYHITDHKISEIADQIHDNKANPASALGEGIGVLIENTIKQVLKELTDAHGYSLKSGDVKNGFGNLHQIDGIIEKDGQYTMLVEAKFLRYTKHNMDKGSRLIVAHHNIRRHYPTIRRCVAILCGNWTKGSKQLIKSFNIDILEVGWEKIAKIFAGYGIDIEWEEDDTGKAKKAWKQFRRLSKPTLKDIAHRIIESIKEPLLGLIKTTIAADPMREKNIVGIEVALQTSHDEFFVSKFSKVSDVIAYLMRFQTDMSDVGRVLR